MKLPVFVASAAIALSSLAGCDQSYEDQIKALEKFASKSRIGSSSDQWLMKYNALGQWEKVALVFGFMADVEFCDEVAELYMSKYPSSRYMCFPAN